MTPAFIFVYAIGFFGFALIHLFFTVLGNGLRTNELVVACLTTIFWPITVLVLFGYVIKGLIEFKKNQREYLDR